MAPHPEMIEAEAPFLSILKSYIPFLAQYPNDASQSARAAYHEGLNAAAKASSKAHGAIHKGAHYAEHEIRSGLIGHLFSHVEAFLKHFYENLRSRFFPIFLIFTIVLVWYIVWSIEWKREIASHHWGSPAFRKEFDVPSRLGPPTKTNIRRSRERWGSKEVETWAGICRLNMSYLTSQLWIRDQFYQDDVSVDDDTDTSTSSSSSDDSDESNPEARLVDWAPYSRWGAPLLHLQRRTLDTLTRLNQLGLFTLTCRNGGKHNDSYSSVTYLATTGKRYVYAHKYREYYARSVLTFLVPDNNALLPKKVRRDFLQLLLSKGGIGSDFYVTVSPSRTMLAESTGGTRPSTRYSDTEAPGAPEEWGWESTFKWLLPFKLNSLAQALALARAKRPVELDPIMPWKYVPNVFKSENYWIVRIESRDQEMERVEDEVERCAFEAGLPGTRIQDEGFKYINEESITHPVDIENK